MSTRIGVLVNSCWNVFNFREGLVKRLLQDGYEVVVLAPSDEYASQIEEWGVKTVDIPLRVTGTNPIQDASYYRRLNKLVKNHGLQLLLSFTIKPNIYGSLVSGKLGIPIICNVSGLGTAFLGQDWIRRTALFLYRRAFKHSDFVFFQNSDDRALFMSRVRMKSGQTGLLPGSGINIHTHQAPPPLFEEPVQFLMVARLIREKGVSEYAKAAEYLKGVGIDANFRLIGSIHEGHSRSYTKEEVQEWVTNEWIDYAGPSDDVLEEIRNSDVVVLPSYREGTPRTLLEGGALSRPLITTDVPGCTEVVKDGVNGFLCEVQDSRSLADKMRLFLALTKEEKLKMATNSRRYIEEKFDESIVIDAYLRKIQQVLA